MPTGPRGETPLPLIFFSALLSISLASGCASRSNIVPVQPDQSSARAMARNPSVKTTKSGGHAPSSGFIQHVVIIIQENRSFNNIFMGFPNATTSSTGLLCDGKTVKLHPVSLGDPYDVGHGLTDFLAAYDNGKGDCFNRERFLGNGKKVKYFPYAYITQSQVAPYWNMAKAYTLADQMFQSNIDASYTAHQYLIAGQAQSSVDIPGEEPWGCDAPSEMVYTITQQRGFGPKQSTCFSYPTLATLLDGAGLTWRFYAPSTQPLKSGAIWSAFDSISQVRNGPEWKADVISPETKILTDPGQGTLANVTWVVPDLKNSDHAQGGKTGPQWVTSVVDAIGTSQFWGSTAIFVVWDDWGGWYDPVPPQYVDYDGLGFRVPLIAISPFALQNNVAHTPYEFGSILRFIEDNWGLNQLAPSDTRATPFGADVFNFSQSPTPFTPFADKSLARKFINEAPSYQPPDDE